MKNSNINNDSTINKRFRLIKGFTLIELLAVIVILALILAIAVPKILSVIESAKIGTLESSAKMIASMAEKSKVQNQVLGKTELITCETVSKLNDIDYKYCYIDFVENTAHVTIKGSNKFEGMFICEGTKSNSKVTDKCPNQRVNVTLDLNAGNIVNDITGVYSEGTILDIEEPTRENYKFIKWDITSGNGKLEDNKFTVGSDNAIISAVWELNIIKLNVIPNGGTITQSFQEEYIVGSQIELENPTKTGNTFEGWSVSGKNASINNNILIMGVEDTTITANWIPNIYSINYELNGGTLGSNSPTSGSYGSTIEISNPTRENYMFTHWTVSGTGALISGTNLTIGASNITLTANWKIINAIPLFTYTGSYQIVDDNDNVISSASENWKIRFLTGGTLKFTDLRGAEDGIDVFLVGGGGSGGGSLAGTAGGYLFSAGGGGGGGGYRTTQKGIAVSTTTTYTITVGAAGGTSTAFGYSAAGGSNGQTPTGLADFDHLGWGGSGGVAGGTGGINGQDGANGSSGGYEFGDSSGKIYGGGGGGGHGYSGVIGRPANYGLGGDGGGGHGNASYYGISSGHNGTDNTGGGGGGASYYNGNLAAGTGGTGIVIIRNKR